MPADLKADVQQTCHRMQCLFGKVAIHEAALQHGKDARHRFQGSLLLSCFILSMSVRSATYGSTFLSALASAVSIVTPPDIREAAVDAVKEMHASRRLPSKSTLGRLRFRMDIVIMLFWRSRFQTWFETAVSKVHIFLGIDASPQGGRDYEMILLRILEKEHMPQLFENVLILEQISMSMSIDELLADIDELKRLMKDIRERLIDHCLPPVVLGAGSGSLARRCSKLVHAFMLELGSFSLVSRVLASVCCMCSDYGSESLLSKTLPVPIRELAPWFSEPAGAQEMNVEQRFVED